MEYGKRLNPKRSLRTPKGIKRTRQKVIVTQEIVKCGFWCKLPLLPLLWHTNAVDEN